MRRALGKGLSQLIAEQFETSPTEAPIEDIVPNPRQPRTVFMEAALEELADSIRQYGVLQPLIVRPVAEGKYELIAGERRLRASKLAGLTHVPIILRAAGNQSSLELALIENVQREDINPLECAHAYRKLAEEFGLTQEQVAEKVGKSRVVIANTIRLLRLPKRIQDGLYEGRITEGHARALLSFESEAQQLAVFEQVIERGLTVREVESASKKAAQAAGTAKQPKPEPPKPEPRDPNMVDLERNLSTFLGAPTKLQPGPTGSKLVIEYYGDEDLQRILDLIGFQP